MRPRAQKNEQGAGQGGRPTPEKPGRVQDEQWRLAFTKANTLKGRPPGAEEQDPARCKDGDRPDVDSILVEKLMQGLMLPPDKALPYLKLFLDYGVGLPRRHRQT